VGSTAPPRGVRHQPGALAHDPSKPLPEPLPGVDFAAWRRIVEQARSTHPALASVLELASPRRVGPSGVTLGFPPNSFEAARITEPRYAEPLARALQGELGPEARVSIELSDAAYGELTLGKVLNAERWERREAARRRIAAHPLVRAVIEELGAELKDVKVSED
jgi:DNA polymerase-3 subunit gamma/tau